jgi:hypothetical protein
MKRSFLLGQPGADVDDAAFAEALRKLQERFAEIAAADPASPPLPSPPKPWADKPGTLIAAEKEVWHWELIEKLELAHCGGPERCPHACCRRSRHCAKADALKPLIAAARATLAREQAKWKR